MIVGVYTIFGFIFLPKWWRLRRATKVVAPLGSPAAPHFAAAFAPPVRLVASPAGGGAGGGAGVIPLSVMPVLDAPVGAPARWPMPPPASRPFMTLSMLPISNSNRHTDPVAAPASVMVPSAVPVSAPHSLSSMHPAITPAVGYGATVHYLNHHHHTPQNVVNAPSDLSVCGNDDSAPTYCVSSTESQLVANNAADNKDDMKRTQLHGAGGNNDEKINPVPLLPMPHEIGSQHQSQPQSLLIIGNVPPPSYVTAHVESDVHGTSKTTSSTGDGGSGGRGIILGKKSSSN